jgi:hypothetical protein
MPNDISVQAVAVARTGSDNAADPKMAAASALPPQAEPVPAPSPIVNPTLRLDAALGLVVIEFRNDSGAITTSIPSERQIEAYQRWEATQFGPTPAVPSHDPPVEPSHAGPAANAPRQHRSAPVKA